MSHRIVIVGGGAGGLELATRLGKTLGKRGTASVMLVDANLTHIWKPLLHEVAAGSLNSSEDELNYVAQAKWNHFEFQLGRMSGLDREQKKIQLAATLDEEGRELVPARVLGYDSLMFAISIGTNTDADVTFTVLVEEGDASNLSDNAAVADADLNGTEALAGFQFDDDTETRKIGYRGSKRYVRLTITPANNGAGNIFMAAIWPRLVSAISIR